MNKNGAPLRYKSPWFQVWGDVIIFMVMVLFYTLSLTLVFGFFSVLIFKSAGVHSILKVCLIPSFIASFLLRFIRLNWQIILGEGTVRLGNCLYYKTIDYRRIYFISHGTLTERLFKEQHNQNKPVTSIIIKHYKPGKSKILLETNQAVRCFHYLMQHSHNAAGVDLDNKKYLPKGESGDKRGIKYLHWKKIVNGYGSIMIGSFCILLAYFGVNEYKDTFTFLQDEVLRIFAMISGMIWIGFGIKILR